MTTALIKSLNDELIDEIDSESEMTLIFTAPTWWEALNKAREAFIENVDAWSQRACLCNAWTVTYRVKRP